jgi:hypothetical protein
MRSGMKSRSLLGGGKLAAVLVMVASFGVGLAVSRATRPDDSVPSAQAAQATPRLASVDGLPAARAAKPKPKKKPAPKTRTSSPARSAPVRTPAPSATPRPAPSPVPQVTTTVPVPVTPAPSSTGSFDDSG